MQYDAIILDLDDTLYLEREYVQSGFAHVGEVIRLRFGIADFGERCMELFESGVRGRIFDIVAEEIGITDRIDSLALRDMYRSHKPKISLCPDSETSLQRWINKTKLFLITDGPSVSQRMKIDALGIRSMFEHVIITDEYGREFWKPAEFAYKWIVEENHLNPRRILAIGDNPDKDFVVPLKFGMTAVRIRRKGGLHFDKKTEQSEVLEIGSFLELE
jgi:putative hydrolase of the HAD superfamily